MSIYDEIIEVASGADPTGAPGKLNHPDSAREALRTIGLRRAAGERVRAGAMVDLAEWVPAARAAGVGVAEIARLAGVTRTTVYAILDAG